MEVVVEKVVWWWWLWRRWYGGGCEEGGCREDGMVVVVEKVVWWRLWRRWYGGGCCKGGGMRCWWDGFIIMTVGCSWGCFGGRDNVRLADWLIVLLLKLVD